jgi:hypothetical protein
MVKGWKLVIAMAIVLGLIYAIVWGSLGIKDEPTLFLVRLTARTFCLSFLLAFIASPFCSRICGAIGAGMGIFGCIGIDGDFTVNSDFG